MKSCLVNRGSVLLAACTAATSAQAFDFSWGDATFQLNNHLSEGAAWRLERPDPNQIGKLDLPGQENLCRPTNILDGGCLSFKGTVDPAPNLKIVNAPGAFSGANGDQGDLNFKQYDVVSGVSKLDSDLTAKWGNFSLKVSGTAMFDPVNANLQNKNPQSLLPGNSGMTYQSPTSDAPAQSRRLEGRTIFLRDAALTYSNTFMDRNYAISVGQQTVHWGEAGYLAINSLNEINPPDERLLHTPGVRFNQIFQPVPLVKLNTDLFEGASFEGIYQLGWRPVVVDQPGTFYSDKNFIGDHDPLNLTLSQVPTDPNQISTIPGIASLISSSSTTTFTQGQKDHYASNWGQYGVHFTYFAQNLLGGTEFGIYYLRYNARLPSFSAMAADNSCLRYFQSTTGFVGTLLNAAETCNGFKGELGPTLNKIPFIGHGQPGLEPLPFDTVSPFFEYPEGIRMLGLSFNTNLFGWAFSGEYSYRPNVPVQVALPDIVMAAEQPALPQQVISLGPLGAIPGASVYFPSFLMKYRGYGSYNSNGIFISNIQPHQYIPGFERLRVGQLDLTALKAIPNGNWFGADQIVLVTEIGFTQIFNMPGEDQIQFESGNLNTTQAGYGADGTGGTTNPDGTPYTLRFNPTQQVGGFGQNFAWGMRVQARFEYDNFYRGITWKPQILLGQDFSNVAPFPEQNFIGGRTQLQVDNQFVITPAFSAQLIYQMSTGGGRLNTQDDRDTIAAVLSYDF